MTVQLKSSRTDHTPTDPMAADSTLTRSSTSVGPVSLGHFVLTLSKELFYLHAMHKRGKHTVGG